MAAIIHCVLPFLLLFQVSTTFGQEISAVVEIFEVPRELGPIDPNGLPPFNPDDRPFNPFNPGGQPPPNNPNGIPFDPFNPSGQPPPNNPNGRPFDPFNPGGQPPPNNPNGRPLDPFNPSGQPPPNNPNGRPFDPFNPGGQPPPNNPNGRPLDPFKPGGQPPPNNPNGRPFDPFTPGGQPPLNNPDGRRPPIPHPHDPFNPPPIDLPPPWSRLAEVAAQFRPPPIRFSLGFINITQNGDTLTLQGKLTGLPPAQSLGFHFHQHGDLRDGCNAAGPHYNPYGVTHGGPNDPVRHVGDLGSINVDRQGNANIFIIVRNVSLSGPNSIIGRSLVVHNMTDDLGRGGVPASATTGNSGGRLACGVVGLIDPTPPCSDRRQDCAQIINQCRDPQHEKQMIRDCRKTCGYCDCRDKDSRCPQFEEWCKVGGAEHVRDMCKLTCGLCNCKDMGNDCSGLSDFCNDPTYGPSISRRCRQTCKKC